MTGEDVSAVGFDFFQPNTWHEAVENPGKVVQEAGRNLAHPDVLIRNAAHSMQPILQGAKSIMSIAASVVSLIPGIGTGISAAIAAGLAILEGGGPIDIALKTAFGAIPIPPGIKQFAEYALDGALALYHALSGGPSVADAAVAAATAAAREALKKRLPSFAVDLAMQAFDTLAHIVVGAITGSATHAAVTHTGQKVPLASTSKTHLALHMVKHAPEHVAAVAMFPGAPAGLQLVPPAGILF